MAIKFIYEEDPPEEFKEYKLKIPGFGAASNVMLKRNRKNSPDFVLDWESELGYRHDPFRDEIIEPVSRFIAGYEEERQKINLFILENNTFGTISGRAGSGKSIMLGWLSEKLKGFSDKVFAVRIDAGSIAKADIFRKDILSNLKSRKAGSNPMQDYSAVNFIDTVIDRLKGRILVILIDDAGSAGREVIMLLDTLFSKISMRVVAAASDPEPFLRSSKSAGGIDNSRFEDGLSVRLEGIEAHEAKSMIEARVKRAGARDIYPFDFEIIQRLTQESEGIPRKILNAAQKTAKQLAVEKSKGSSLDDVRMYHREGIDLGKNGYDMAKITAGKTTFEPKRGSDYKISVVSNSTESIIIDTSDSDKKKTGSESYRISKVK